MPCATYGTTVVCGPPRSTVRRRILVCWNCQTKRRVAQVYQGIWYADHFYCCHCGDGWGDGERMERPFQRGWREKAIKRARDYWDEAVAKEAYDARWKADLAESFEPAERAVEDVVEDL